MEGIDNINMEEERLYGKDNMDEENMNNNQVYVQSSRKWKEWIWTAFCILLSAVVFTPVGYFAGHQSSKNDKHNDNKLTNPPIPSNTLQLIGDGNIYRLHENSSSIECTWSLKTYIEKKHCPSRRYSEYTETTSSGSVVYKCGGTSYSFQHLLNFVQQEINTLTNCVGIPRTLSCCLLSYLGNLNNYCNTSQSDTYSCYVSKVHTDRNMSSLEPMCDKPYNVTKLMCKCYHTTVPVCGEEMLPRCEELTEDPSIITKCKIKVTRNKQPTICVCHHTHSDQKKYSEHVQSCTDLSVEALTNDVHG